MVVSRRGRVPKYLYTSTMLSLFLVGFGGGRHEIITEETFGAGYGKYTQIDGPDVFDV